MLTGPVTRTFVVVSGLPASGKTTLSRLLSKALDLPLLDKDDILESLFASLGVETRADRERLSRASDHVLEVMAAASAGAVLSSFWRRAELSSSSGTPTGWLRELPGATVIEVLCECPPSLAAQRFAGRARHVGHFDRDKPPAELIEQLERLAACGPLAIGHVVRVDTRTTPDVGEIARAVLSHVNGGAPPC